jgi:hypothetical protein
MPLDQRFLKRLTFIKYLYSIALEQSRKAEPMCYASLLTFHDAIELFFDLSAECVGINLDVSFMASFEEIDKQLTQGELSQKESVRRLNKARVNLKHDGLFPSILDIEAYRATATNFFEENTPLIFKINFSDISLAELISDIAVKEKIKSAEELLIKEAFEASLNNTAIAFQILIDNYFNKKDLFFTQPAFFTRTDQFMLSVDFPTIEMSSFGTSNYDPKMQKFTNLFTILFERINMLGLGIDYLKYAKFLSIIPEVHQGPVENWYTRKKQCNPDKITKDHCDFCLQFVVESAIQIQRLESNLKNF